MWTTELNANPRDLDLYARRGPTLSAHLERVREHLGLTAFDEKARQRLAPFVFKGRVAPTFVLKSLLSSRLARSILPTNLLVGLFK